MTADEISSMTIPPVTSPETRPAEKSPKTSEQSESRRRTPAEEETTQTRRRIVGSAVQMLDTAEGVDTSLSAIASAKTGPLSAQGSAIGMANVDGTAEARMSVIGVIAAKGDAAMHQSYASAFVAGNNVSMSQSGSAAVVARTVSFEQAGSGIAVASEASVRHGFIGLLLAGKAEVSEDSKVLLSGRSALLIAAALLGGLGLVAFAVMYSANRVSRWRPNISLPSWARRH